MVPREFGGGAVVERLWQSAARLPVGGALIGVSSADGGVGRSAITAALGGVLACAVPRLVLAVDATGRSWGGLTERVADGDGTVWDAVAGLNAADTTDGQMRPQVHIDLETVLGWTRRTPAGLHALVAEPQRTAQRRPPVLRETRTAVDRLHQHFAVALLDLPVADVRSAWQSLRDVTVPILVARAGVDSLRHTQRLLAQLRAAGLGDVVDRTVLAVVATVPNPPREAKALCRQTAELVRLVVEVPYDPHLARPEPVDPRRTRRATRQALLELAAACLTRSKPTAGPSRASAAATDADAPPASAAGRTATA
ncbi:hypothetical protein GCM10009827_115570 [Dactylosporangium maewongense]|uniref:MinD-like ATPase involved in chromosome partitioning or flagellar assembly n=1 Tax=Dactylosporangium maewongense TaxID=634393 RepID=A0ABP4P657_9ACTN